MAVGRIWHVACFVCGGTSGKKGAAAGGADTPVHGLGCGRKLKRDGYLDHENNPYCPVCHAKLATATTATTAAATVLQSPSNVLPQPRMNSTPGGVASPGTVSVGTRAVASSLHKEAGYVGDDDEVDESEW